MKLKKIRQKVMDSLIKAQALAMAVWGAILSTIQPVACADEWEQLADSSGVENIFKMIGMIYAKFAWLPGILLFLLWMFKRGDKAGEVGKNGFIAVAIGYAVFAVGAVVWISFFNAVGGGFGTGLE